MDPICCESKSWMETANVDILARGLDQPFFQDRFDHPYISFFVLWEGYCWRLHPRETAKGKIQSATP